jgi:hypothetical protein
MNPDPSKTVRWGAASETEMMDGWVEYVDAVPGSQPELPATAAISQQQASR